VEILEIALLHFGLLSFVVAKGTVFRVAVFGCCLLFGFCGEESLIFIVVLDDESICLCYNGSTLVISMNFLLALESWVLRSG
jgi:hypothetical protein